MQLCDSINFTPFKSNSLNCQLPKKSVSLETSLETSNKAGHIKLAFKPYFRTSMTIQRFLRL